MKTVNALMPYQHKMIEQIVNVPKCGLFAQMGLGKTVSTLTGIKKLLMSFEVSKVLVVAPLRVARKVWTDELEEWSHLGGLFRTSKIIGTVDQRIDAKGVAARRDPLYSGACPVPENIDAVRKRVHGFLGF